MPEVATQDIYNLSASECDVRRFHLWTVDMLDLIDQHSYYPNCDKCSLLELCGQIVQQAGDLCCALGFTSLFTTSKEIGSGVNSHQLPVSGPVCSEVKARAFLSDCVAQCNAASNSGTRTGSLDTLSGRHGGAATQIHSKDTCKSVAYQWFKRAEEALGENPDRKKAYAWITMAVVTEPYHHSFKLPGFDTWAKYVRDGQRNIRESQPMQEV